MTALSYAVVTPARDEAENVPRLASALEGQTLPPVLWVVVDNGSRDGTAAVIAGLTSRLPSVRLLQVEGEAVPRREATIARAFKAGLELVPADVPLIVKVDADISFRPDYFARLVGAFADDPSLGIASGSGYELERGVWRQQHMTGDAVWGASRAYRRSCLNDILPLEDRVGWDGIDCIKAGLNGWETRTLVELPFFHHRREGEREGSRRSAWEAEGRLAYYLRYRPTYLGARAVYRAMRDPAALAILAGYAGAASAGEPRCPDSNVTDRLRAQQSLRMLPRRAHEALGRRRGR